MTVMYEQRILLCSILGMADTKNRFIAVHQTVCNLVSFIYCNQPLSCFCIHQHIYSIVNASISFLLDIIDKKDKG